MLSVTVTAPEVESCSQVQRLFEEARHVDVFESLTDLVV